MKAAETFARHVHDSWGVGMQSSCGGTGVLLFLSELDRTVYISRGSALEPILTKYRIDRIIRNMRPSLQQKQYGQAILTALSDIDNYIREGPPSASEGTGEMALAGAMVLGFFGLFALSARRHERNRRQYTHVASHLDAMDQQRAKALQGQYQAKSCPICLEDFCPATASCNVQKGSDGLPLKLLRCGHVFD
jgi:hypothetical protein